MKKYLLPVLVVSMLALAQTALAAATLTVTPQEVRPGETITVTVTPQKGWGTSRFAWISKGNQDLAVVAFPCYQMCFSKATRQFTIPSTWTAGSNYSARILDHSTANYVRAYFRVIK